MGKGVNQRQVRGMKLALKTQYGLGSINLHCCKSAWELKVRKEMQNELRLQFTRREQQLGGYRKIKWTIYKDMEEWSMGDSEKLEAFYKMDAP